MDLIFEKEENATNDRLEGKDNQGVQQEEDQLLRNNSFYKTNRRFVEGLNKNQSSIAMERNEREQDERKNQIKEQKKQSFQTEMMKITLLMFRKEYLESEERILEEKYITYEKLKEEIREQMEYYFCDSNLIRDPYLRGVISHNSPSGGCVDIKVFLKFNKIKNLMEQFSNLRKIKNGNTMEEEIDGNQKKGKFSRFCRGNESNQLKREKIEFIRSSLKQSSILSVKSDSLKVKRIVPFDLVTAKRNSDERTIFVDNIPAFSSKMAFLNLFSGFQITHVSLPKRKDGSYKGYGYVEFSSVEEQQNVLVQGIKLPFEGGNEQKQGLSEESNQEQQLQQQQLTIMSVFQKEELKEKNNLLKYTNGNKPEDIEGQDEQNSQQIQQIEGQNQSFQDNQQNQQKLQQKPFREIQMKKIPGVLVKIVGLQQDVSKSELMIRIRQLGYPFYCDLGKDETNQDDNELKEEDKSGDILHNSKEKNHVLKPNEALIRFESQHSLRDALKALLEINSRLEIDLNGVICPVKLVPQNSEEENKFWTFITQKKNDFRKAFHERKLLKKRKL